METLRTAAVLLIGNELLSGKIADANLPFLAQELFGLGIHLKRAVVCGDDVDPIAEELRDLRGRCDLVITTGGVGPTHDDVTLEAVAKAVGRPLVADPATVELIREWFGGDVQSAHLRLAMVPEGAELIASEDVRWPTVFVDGVLVFPGVPEIIRRKWPPVRERLRLAALQKGFVSRAVYCTTDEFGLAETLEALDEAYPDVSIGSYLRWGDADYRTKVTFDGQDPAAVDAAVAACIDAMGAAAVVRVE